MVNNMNMIFFPFVHCLIKMSIYSKWNIFNLNIIGPISMENITIACMCDFIRRK